MKLVQGKRVMTPLGSWHFKPSTYNLAHNNSHAIYNEGPQQSYSSFTKSTFKCSLYN